MVVAHIVVIRFIFVVSASTTGFGPRNRTILRHQILSQLTNGALPPPAPVVVLLANTFLASVWATYRKNV